MSQRTARCKISGELTETTECWTNIIQPESSNAECSNIVVAAVRREQHTRNLTCECIVARLVSIRS
jgi:hypothetical protein